MSKSKTGLSKESTPRFEISKYTGWRSSVNVDYFQYEKNSPIEITLQRAHTKKIKDVVFSPDGKLIVTTERGRAVKIWNTEGALLRTIALPLSERDAVRSWISFAPDGRSIVIGGVQKSLWIFDLKGKLVKKLTGSDYDFDLIVMSRDRSIIATEVYQNNTGTTSGLVIRDKSWKVRRIIETGRGSIGAIAVNHDGKYIATTPRYGNYKTSMGWTSSVRVWSREGKLIGELEVNKPPSAVTGKKESVIKKVTWITFSPDSKHVAILANNHKLNIRSLDGKLVSHIKLVKCRYWPKKCFFTPDGKSVIIANRNFVEKFGIQGRNEGWFKIQPGVISAGIDDIDISPDGRFIAAGYWSHDRHGGTREKGSLRIWDWRGKLVAYIREHALEVKGVGLSPDNRRLIMELKHYEKSIIWDLNLNRLDRISESIRFDGRGREYRFSYYYGPGKRVFYNKLRIRHRGGESFFKYRLGDWYVLTPDGNIVETGEGSMDIFDINGKPLRRVDYPRGFTDIGKDRIVFTPDGKNFIWGSFRQSIMLYSQRDQKREGFKTGYRVTAAAVERGGRYIASGHQNGDIYLWTKRGKRVRTLKEHVGKVNDLVFSRDGKYLISTSNDRTVIIWNVTTGSSLTLVVYGTGDWVAFDERGHFDCSDGAREYVRFIRGMTAYSFQQFWNDFFTPGLASRVVTGKKLRAVDIVKKVRSAPLVTVRQGSIEEGKAVVTVCAKHRGNGVGRIFLFHNGRALDEMSRGLTVNTRGDCRIFHVPLTPGENIIIGGAYDRDNAVFGRSERIFVTYAPVKTEKPDMYILAVGVSDYKDSNINLKSPANDAEAISRAFKNVGSSLYGDVYTYTLTDEKAIKISIKERMSEILQRAKKIDTVILFLAGHGDMEKGTYYYLPYDADITNLKVSCISISDLSKFAQVLSANKIAIFLDTCKSGSATKGLSTIALTRGFDDRRIIADLAKERGIVVFSAASTSQDAYEIKAIRHGIFTYCILDALKNRIADISIGNRISIARLLSLVNRATRDTAYKYLKVEQSPILYMFGDDFSIGLVK